MIGRLSLMADEAICTNYCYLGSLNSNSWQLEYEPERDNTQLVQFIYFSQDLWKAWYSNWCICEAVSAGLVLNQ